MAAFYAFAALLIGAAVLLAVGVVPAWVEWIAAAFLWALVSFVYLLLVGSFLMMLGPLHPYMRPASPELQIRRGQGRKPRRIRSWARYLAQRLLQLVFLAALVISGRPVLAGLYFLVFFTITALQVRVRMWQVGGERPDVSAGQWAVYQTFRLPFQVVYSVWRLLRYLAKWCLWIPILTTVLACLSRAGIRVKRPLRESLGLPRTLAGFLYVPPWRRIWKQVLPLCFWLIGTGLALGLAFDALSVAGKMSFVTALWAIGFVLLPLLLLSFIVATFGEDSLSSRHQSSNWPRHPGPYLRVVLQLVFLGALCFANQWVLAGLYSALICLAYATAWVRTIESNDEEHDYANPFPMVTAVVGMGLALGPFLILASPILLPWLVWEYWSDIRSARKLREIFGKPEGFIYFLCAEPHQQNYFLGSGGVLTPFGDQVIARNWREDIRPAREGPDWGDFQRSPEGRLLKRFDVSRLRDHLPFVAVVSSRSRRPKGFQISKAYRARRRDKGAALRKLEERIKKAANKAFGTVGT